MLRFVALSGRVEVEDVASQIDVTRQKAKYLLDELTERKLLDVQIDMFGDRPDRYDLTHAGRAVLDHLGVL